MSQSKGRSQNQALVRRPGPLLANGELTHLERVPVDFDLARRQWERYVATLADNGWKIIEVAPADDCPDAVFVEDPVVVFGNLAVITRPGALSRRPETAGVQAAVEAIGLTVAKLTDPATMDGGDVLKVGTTVYVGRTLRTNDAGIHQLAQLIEPLGYRVVAVPTTRVLHLKSAVTALPDGTIIGYEPLVDDPSAFASYLAVPEEAGSHVVHLGHGRLLVASNCPQTAHVFRQLGYDPVLVDISEFEKLEGCVTCLSVRLRGQGTTDLLDA